MDKESIKKRLDFYPKTVIGVIALFVFFTEAIATISLKFVLEANSPYIAHLVWFIVLYPVLLTFLFFFTLWNKVQTLYEPRDFSDSTFLSAMKDSAIKSDSERHAEISKKESPDDQQSPNNTIESDARTSRGSL